MKFENVDSFMLSSPIYFINTVFTLIHVALLCSLQIKELLLPVLLILI